MSMDTKPVTIFSADSAQNPSAQAKEALAEKDAAIKSPDHSQDHSAKASVGTASTPETAKDQEAMKKGAAVRRRNLIISIVFGILFFVVLIWLLRSSSSATTQKIQHAIESAGIFGPILFVLLSVFTSYIPIVPLGSMGSIGIVLFHPLPAFFLNTLVSYINCILAFWLARKWGTRFIYQIASPETVDKYEKRLKNSRHFELIFFLWMMMPVSPDLLLCMLAGLSSMKVSHFLAIILVSRPFSSWCYSTGMLKVFEWIRKAVHL